MSSTKSSTTSSTNSSTTSSVSAPALLEDIFIGLSYSEGEGTFSRNGSYSAQCDDKTIYAFCGIIKGRYLFRNINPNIAWGREEGFFYTTSEVTANKLIKAIENAKNEAKN